MPKFIIEGADRVGKSTIALALSGILSARFGRTAKTAHCNKDSCNWQAAAEVVSIMDGYDIVDRLYDSEAVYSELVRGGCSLSDEQVLNLRAQQALRGMATLFVISGQETIVSRHAASSGEYVSAQQSLAAQLGFVKLYSRLTPINFFCISGELDADAMIAHLTSFVDASARWTPSNAAL